jgi:hypothetical protein
MWRMGSRIGTYMNNFNFNLRFSKFKEVLMRNEIMTFTFIIMIMVYSSILFYANCASNSTHRTRTQDLYK